MADELTGKRVAVLATDGFEESELLEPKRALEQAGAHVDVVSPAQGRIRGWKHTDWGMDVPVDVGIADADANDYDALLLPGGVMNPDRLRTDSRAVAMVRDMFQAGKPVAAICHGPWTLVEAGVIGGFRVTSWPSLRTDLTNAGATWVDEQVVVDRGLVTSRKPDDIPAFNARMIEEFAEGHHERPQAPRGLASSRA
jgi:protease I